MKAFLMLAALLVASLAAHAGPRVVGNGGDVLICVQKDGRMTYRVLDVAEATDALGLKLEDTGEMMVPEILSLWGKRLDKIRNFKPGTGESELKETYLSMRLMSEGIGLKGVKDEGQLNLDAVPISAAGCVVRQLANYLGKNQIYVNRMLWENLDEFNRAALVLHEWVYKIMRSYGDTDSLASRRIVGHLISTTPPADLYEGVPEALPLRCRDSRVGAPFPQAGSFDFYAYRGTCKGLLCPTVLQFRMFKGRLQFSKTAIEISDLDFRRFTSMSSFTTMPVLYEQDIILGTDFLEDHEIKLSTVAIKRKSNIVEADGEPASITLFKNQLQLAVRELGTAEGTEPVAIRCSMEMQRQYERPWF